MVYQMKNTLNHKQKDKTMLLDPSLLRAARQIYLAYSQVHKISEKPVLGVAINPNNYRGQVILGTKPILLPYECFIGINQLKS